MARKHLDTDTCPKKKELKAYRARHLVGKRNEEIFLHLKYCSKCLRLLAKLSKIPSPREIIQKGSSGSGLWQRIRQWWHRLRRKDEA